MNSGVESSLWGAGVSGWAMMYMASSSGTSEELRRVLGRGRFAPMPFEDLLAF